LLKSDSIFDALDIWRNNCGVFSICNLVDTTLLLVTLNNNIDIWLEVRLTSLYNSIRWASDSICWNVCWYCSSGCRALWGCNTTSGCGLACLRSHGWIIGYGSGNDNRGISWSRNYTTWDYSNSLCLSRICSCCTWGWHWS